ncbi:hypothetical protein DPSP01_002508 [Paraphaeosphaeria sporulosa]|uniref:Uncharacterized protein n=1 Tax=Paraphaeosphaeria sporulosa TaxID=1460663 RepID=A0A177CV10_9PLEO|nr:uncharacterized protein CC84DRAFT_1158938 [Paraphaeosphaeria sporulosa]OAG11395.1 hypothetical protein CC84DRAFT_1158938 [Paraphaeosphaeria sporulosa]
MDYQTFNSPQHLPPSFGGPFSTSSAPSHSPQQAQSYQDPQARLQHPATASFPYQQFANGQPGGFPASMPGGASQATSGAVMQPGGLSQSQLQMHQARAAALQQQQQQQQGQASPYSSAPFAQALASPAHQQFIQNRNTASPATSQHTNTASPYATPQQTHSPSVPATQGMNPPTSQPAAAQPMASQTPTKALPQSPVSPVSQAREKQRIDTLLEINQVLIQQVMELYEQGKAGHIGPAPDAKQEGEKAQQPSPEYRDYMRRLQANLAFLAQNAEKHTKPNQNIMPGPAIMVAPSSPDDLVKLYSRLQSLFPGWKGAPNKPSPGPQRLNSTSSQASVQNNMQPPNSAGLHNNMQHPNSAGMPPNMQLPSNAMPNNFQQQQQQQQ